MRMPRPPFGIPPVLWTQRLEAPLNWLALGVLLAAWNAVDDSSAGRRRTEHLPDHLLGYPCVTVRSIARSADAIKGHKIVNEL